MVMSTLPQPTLRQTASGPSSGPLDSAVRDLAEGFRAFPTAAALAYADLRALYARTILGPAWSGFSNAIWIAALAVTFGTIFASPIATYLPYLTAGLALWSFLSGVITGGPTLLLRNSHLIGVYDLPFSTHAFRSVMLAFYMLAQFLVIYLVVAFACRTPLTPACLMIAPALLLYAVFAVGLSLALGFAGVWHRDLAPMVNSAMTLGFLVTPIFWRSSLVSRHPEITAWNPIYHLLTIGRDALLSRPPDPGAWTVSLLLALGSAALGVFALATGARSVRFRL